MIRFGILRNPASTSSKSATEASAPAAKKSTTTAVSTESSATHADVAEPLGTEHFGKLEKALSYQFRDLSLLELALTHRSLPGKAKKGSGSDYERLEFLGDAVLDLAVAHLLIELHPEANEGDLSKMRAALVNTQSLADLARKIGVGPFVRLSKGELANGGADRPSILEDVLEATMGAIYREAGFDEARRVVIELIGDAAKTVTPRDPKTELQEALHAAGCSAPEYLVDFVEGPEHSPTYVSIVKVDGQIVGRGRGPTKKASQQEAASLALGRMRGGDEIDRGFIAPAETAAVASEQTITAEQTITSLQNTQSTGE